ncbi:MAG: hypothetical protein Q9160_001829 [Pyrenula sp. 1 TL-2023]
MATNLPDLEDITRLNGDVIRVLGANPGKSLTSVLRSEKAQIKTCVITHWHQDHVGGVDDLKALSPDVKIWKGSVNGELAQEFEKLKEGMQFEEGGFRVKAVHTPGHTVDHFCLLVEQGEGQGGLFTGDNVLGHGTAVFEDLTTYISSLELMSRTIAPSAPAFPGHGEVISDGKARIDDYIRHRQQREEEVLTVLRYGSLKKPEIPPPPGPRKEMTAMEIVRVIYWDVGEELYEAAEKGVKLILGKMEGESRVERRGQGRWRIVEGTKGSVL